jgi:hypothetical protein
VAWQQFLLDLGDPFDKRAWIARGIKSEVGRDAKAFRSQASLNEIALQRRGLAEVVRHIAETEPETEVELEQPEKAPTPLPVRKAALMA